MTDQEIIMSEEEKDVEPQNGKSLPEGWSQHYGEDGLVYTFNDNGDSVCGARTRSKGYCRKAPLSGRNRCKLHGGASPRGIASASYKHGSYSKDLPSKLAERYLDAMTDDELLSLRSDIALLQTRVSDQLSNFSEGGTGELFVQACEIYNDLIKALGREDQVESQHLLSELGKTLKQGSKEHFTWQGIEETLEKKRKLSDSERKRLVDLKQMVTVEELMIVTGALVDSVRRHVSDQQALVHISNDLRELLQDRGLSG